MKNKSRFLLPFLTFLTFGMVTGSVLASDYVKEMAPTVEADATTNTFPRYLYFYFRSNEYGQKSDIKSVWAYMWNTDVSAKWEKMTALDYNNDNDDGRGYVLRNYDSKFDGGNVIFVMSNSATQSGWDYKIKQSVNLSIPNTESSYWVTSGYGQYGDDYGKLLGSWTNVYHSYAYNYDSTTTCNVTGEYVGVLNENLSPNTMTFTVNSVPDTKVAALGQYSNSDFSSLTNEHALTNNQLSISTWTFTSNAYFKPILYDKHFVSLNNGSSWNELSFTPRGSDTDGVVTFSSGSISLTAGSKIKFKSSSATLSSIYLEPGSNVYPDSTAGTFVVKNSTTGTIDLKRGTDGGYSIWVDGNAPASNGHYFLNMATGTYISCTENDSKQKADEKVYIEAGSKIALVNYTGSGSGKYGVNSINSATTSAGTFRFHTDNDSTVECLISDYYYLEKQLRDSTYYDIFYAGSWGADLSIHYNGKGGTDPEDPTRVCKDTKLIESKIPVTSVTGYYLEGWYTDDTFNTKWDFGTDTVSGDMDLYARWLPRSYTLSGTCPSGTVSFGTNPANYGSVVSFTITGNKGYLNSSGSLILNSSNFTLYDDPDNLANTASVSFSATGYASFNINFEKNGGTGSTMSSQSYTYNTDPGAETLPACTYTKENYSFKEWNTRADGTGTSFKAGDKLTVSQINELYPYTPGTPGGNVSFYAIWVLNVTYNVVSNNAIGYSFTADKAYLSSNSIHSIKVTRPNPGLLEDTNEDYTITDTRNNIDGTESIMMYIKVNSAQLNDPIKIEFFTSTDCTGEAFETIDNTVAEVISGKVAEATSKQKDIYYSMLVYGHFGQAVFGHTQMGSPIQYVPTAGSERSNLLTAVNDVTVSTVGGTARTIAEGCDFTNFKVRGGNNGDAGESNEATLMYRYIFDSEDFNSHDYKIGSLSGLSSATATLTTCIDSSSVVHHCIEIKGIKASEIGTLFTVTILDGTSEAFSLTQCYQNYLAKVVAANTSTTNLNQVLLNRFAKATFYYYTKVTA